VSVSAVLFDIGRVVLDWEPARLYAKIFDTAEETEHFLANVCTMTWHTRHDAGVSFADNAEHLIAENPEYADEIRAWGGRWMEMFDGYVEGTPALMERLKAKSVAMFALTNMPSETWPMMQTHFPVMGEFEHVVVSGDLGVVKPDPEIYLHALKKIGEKTGVARARDVFFIDDSLPNIEAADALGFATHHFKDAAGLEKALLREGLI
jgi:HAD superfamily hydrolase (TIGR01549 family)